MSVQGQQRVAIIKSEAVEGESPQDHDPHYSASGPIWFSKGEAKIPRQARQNVKPPAGKNANPLFEVFGSNDIKRLGHTAFEGVATTSDQTRSYARIATVSSQTAAPERTLGVKPGSPQIMNATSSRAVCTESNDVGEEKTSAIGRPRHITPFRHVDPTEPLSKLYVQLRTGGVLAAVDPTVFHRSIVSASDAVDFRPYSQSGRLAHTTASTSCKWLSEEKYLAVLRWTAHVHDSSALPKIVENIE